MGSAKKVLEGARGSTVFPLRHVSPMLIPIQTATDKWRFSHHDASRRVESVISSLATGTQRVAAPHRLQCM
jgi:hypothetical protein